MTVGARALALALALLAPPAAIAAPLAHREVLPNGIVLLVAERPAVPIVAVRAFVRAGSAFDPPEAPGLANLTASVLTRGTAARSAPQIDEAIEFVGGSLEADATRDGTTVALYVLRKDLGLGLDLLADVVQHPSFPADEFARAVREIEASIRRSEEDPESVASRELMGLVYAAHPYGHPVEGTRESVAALTRDQVTAFHHDHFRPDAVIIAVVGAVTVEDARREILARFGTWPRPDEAAPGVRRALATAAPQTRTVTRELTQTTMVLGRSVVRQDDPDYFPLVVANYVLGGGSVSRLYTRVRDQAGLAYAVGSYVAPGRYGATAVVSLQTRAGEAARALGLVHDELRRLTTETVTADELSLAKAYLIGSFPRRLDTSAKVASFLVAVEEQGLGLDYADTFAERIARVTAEDVRRVAARYLAPESFDTVIVGSAPPPAETR